MYYVFLFWNFSLDNELSMYLINFDSIRINYNNLTIISFIISLNC